MKPLTKSSKTLPETNGLLIHCAFDSLVQVGKLKPYPRNNKTHPETQMELLCKAIKAQGWRTPITVSNQSGYIVRGHARLEAAKRLGCDKVPVDYQDYASTEAERADRIADNKLAELAEWNMDNLKNELLELDTGKLDIGLTGFNEKAMEDLMTNLPFDQCHNQVYAQMELQPHEHYDYLIVLAENEQDFQWLLARLKIEKCQDAKKSQSIGLGRAIKAARLIKELDK